MLHSKVEPDSEEEKPRDAEALFDGSGGPASIVVSGGAVSTGVSEESVNCANRKCGSPETLVKSPPA